MLSSEIRKKFLDFFKSKGHEIVPSDSLVPKADPSLLFTSAGMNQFKEQFLGHNITYRRAASSQKCLRTADLDKVGKTPYHHTFFEMLGNFSFGDYFKKEAISWAWEFMTDILGINEKKLWVSVYKDDEESYDIWKSLIKVPAKRIKKFSAKENFWPSNAKKFGPNGPCGPCSEIFYEWDKDNSVEAWNLVFTQFDRKEGGKLDFLPSKNIDTGMGLERITAVMQNVKTNFETDLFVPIIGEIKNPALPAGRQKSKIKKEDLNAIADHIRAATFAIADGVAPSNEERGYVIRKLIRRAYLRGGTQKPFLYNIVPKVVEIMKDTYPELLSKRGEISFIVKEEEEKFEHALSVAMPILENDLKMARNKLLQGEKIFKLVDTYGLPLEVIESEAARKKIKLDVKDYENLMEERRKLSRKKSKIAEDIFALDVFVKLPSKISYSDKLPLKAKIALMAREIPKGKAVIVKASEGENIYVMTDPQSNMFYTEAGGQVGDKGTIRGDEGFLLEILNTVKIDDKTVHVAKVIKGKVAIGDTCEINVENERKKRIARNHTATHLLQAALRKVLGEHVHQAGSLVAEDRLRFDFTHMKKLEDRELEMIEAIVNEYIDKGLDVKKEVRPLDIAKKEGAIALFGEKYDDRVTVVSVGGAVSKEVCGGTHVDNTKDIGLFKIIRESSVASGVRRIEALTSDYAREWMEESEKRKAKSEKLIKEKEEEKKSQKEILKRAEEGIGAIIKKASNIKGIKVVIEEVKNVNMGILRSLADRIKEREKSAFVLLATRDDDKISLVLSVTQDLVSKGFDASKEITEMADMVGGRGGGRPDFAQAGGREPSKLNRTFEFAKNRATEFIGGMA